MKEHATGSRTSTVRRSSQQRITPAAETDRGPASILTPIAESGTLDASMDGMRNLPIQRKLSVGAPNDPLEHEADAMADRVMRKPAAPFVASDMTHEGEDEDERRLHRKPLASGITPFAQAKEDAGGIVSDSVSSTIESSRGGGSPLPDSSRNFMESRFGADFSDVRIHTGDYATQTSKELNAQAFTLGNDIYFNSGKFSPESQDGQRLLAHELTHTVQQSGGEGSVRTKLIQRFESDEHQHLGDTATGGAMYELATKPRDSFKLSHGDILALNGDVFGDKDNPNELFDLAAIPGKKGEGVGTRDEIIWALQDPKIWEMRAVSKNPTAPKGPYAGKTDPRMVTGGLYGDYKFSENLKTVVLSKYQKRGAANQGHFVSPSGRDAAGGIIADTNSAGDNYHTQHLTAIQFATDAGRAGRPIDMPMAREAAAQHYLTDAFSAGHLRTPIGMIRKWWHDKYPLFWWNLRHKIALDTAIEMASGTPITTHFIYAKILDKVEKMAPDIPPVTLGDLLGSVYHDYDNENGLNLASGGKVFGDKHLHQSPDTERMALSAIAAGNNDIKIAYTYGKNMASTPATTKLQQSDIESDVRQNSGAPAGKFAAEMQTPIPSTNEPSQNWKADSIEQLWDKKFVGAGKPTASDTVGAEITRRVQGEGSIAVQLTSLKEKFPESMTGFHPQAGYMKGFVGKLQADPRSGILDTVHWAPHGMGTGYAPSETYNELKANQGTQDKVKKDEQFVNMTFEQRVKYVKGMISDGTVDDQKGVMDIFESMRADWRPELYRRVEGHPWTGDFHRKFGSRDDLYKLLSEHRVAKLKKLINQA